MNVRDSHSEHNSHGRDPEKTLVEDWEFHAWFGESKGAQWRGRVGDLTDDVVMKHTNKSRTCTLDLVLQTGEDSDSVRQRVQKSRTMPPVEAPES